MKESEKPVTDLLYEICKRAKELAQMKMPLLRSFHPEITGTGSAYEALQVTEGMSRGQIIEDILLDEFEGDVESIERTRLN